MVLIQILVSICLLAGFSKTTACKSSHPRKYTTEHLIDSLSLDQPNYIVPNSIIAKSVKLEQFFPANFVKDGSKDYTSIIQSVLLDHRNIVFPNFPLLINDNGISVPSNTNIVFLKGSKLILKASNKTGYNIINIKNSIDVNLYNPVIVGDRDSHLSQTGEWGMGIGIYGSQKISIINPQISKCFGDGIYIGTFEKINCDDVIIKNAIIKNNLRNGISIIGVNKLMIENCFIANNDGVKPMCGIDIEPNGPQNEIKNVILRNITTKENPGSGIQVDVGNLIGKTPKFVSININNHTDIGSNVGMKVMSRIPTSNSSIQGEVNISNCIWSNNAAHAITTILYGKQDVHLRVIDPKIIDTHNRKLSKSESISYLKQKGHINTDAWADVEFSN